MEVFTELEVWEELEDRSELEGLLVLLAVLQQRQERERAVSEARGHLALVDLEQEQLQMP
jgi:hypothetical protein